MHRNDPRGATGSTAPSRGDRALSEVLSYVLIFTILVASIGIVTVGGIGSLQDARTNEHVSNAERAYDVLHDNMADVHAEGAPSRATEIALGDAQLYLDDQVTIEVETQDATGTEVTDATFRPIVFRIDGERKLVYEAGATLITQRDGGVVLNRPPFTFRESPGRVHVPIVQTSSPTVRSVGGGNVLVRGQSAERSIAVSDQSGSTAIREIRLDSPRADTWERFFEQQDYCSSASVTGTVVTCDVDSNYENPEQLYVTVQGIDVTLIK